METLTYVIESLTQRVAYLHIIDGSTHKYDRFDNTLTDRQRLMSSGYPSYVINAITAMFNDITEVTE